MRGTGEDPSPRSQHSSRINRPKQGMASYGRGNSRLDTEAFPPAPFHDDDISPWGNGATSDLVAPWDIDPQAHVSGTRPFPGSYFNDMSRTDHTTESFTPPPRPITSRTNTTDSRHYDPEARRPSAASATTTSSIASYDSTTNRGGGRFRRKNLKGLLGEDPTDDVKSSQTNLGDLSQNGNNSERSTIRNNSVVTARSADERPKTPLPSSDVTPWAYQNFEDVSNFGSAPIRQELLAGADTSKTNGTATSSKRSLLHRHSKSKEESQKSSSTTPTLKRPSTSRDSSQANLPFLKPASHQNTAPLSISTAPRAVNPMPRSHTEAEPPTEKRSVLKRVFGHRHKDKAPSVETSQTPTSEPTKPAPAPLPRKRAFSRDKQIQEPDTKDARDREASNASADSTLTVKQSPLESFPKIDRTYTAVSQKTSRFGRHNKPRGLSHQSQASEKPQMDKARGSTAQQTPAQASIFNLDMNFDDLSDIIGPQPAQSAVGESPTPWGSNMLLTPSKELPAPAWDAPDSWAVKPQIEEAKDQAQIFDEGLEAIDEEDGISYFMRVFRTDGTFATLSMTINATVGEVMQSLSKKSFLHDPIENYHLLLRKNQLSRQLESAERPIAMQKRLLLQAGYQEEDRIEEIGRDDNSYLCRFTFSHEKQTGFGSSLENDPVFNKMQKFSAVDLSGRALITIPIILYTRAPEIISLNISRNLALTVPKDFIAACINLREIKFTGNEARRLPPSLSSASRMTILDISNNNLEQLDHADLHRVSGLVSLKLANNHLTNLPINFSHFRHLRSLNISSNNFKALPDHVCSIKSLVDLDISFNKISSIPIKISNLTALERLWMTNNGLNGPLPESLKSLANLKEIDARFNAITNVENVMSLANLEQLAVGHNKITSFTGSFSKLRNLVMDHCPITHFEITEPVPSLSVLNIASANLIEFKDSMFDFLPNLQKLNLDKNHFTTMSAQIGRLTRLEWLSMAKNKINVVPASVGSLVELKYLNLRENNVKALPPEIWYCRRLETLNLSSNVLEFFPKQNAAPPPEPKDYVSSSNFALSTSPSFEELGKLEDFQARRPSQASAGMLSVGSSPATSHRKNSIASMYQPSARKMSVISRTNTEVSISTATRKDSNLSQARLQNTFAGSLRYLYLADNRLEDEVFREIVHLPELRMLNLSYNVIDDFPSGVLRRWPQMTELYLSGNSLTSLPSDDLEESSNLRTLHLNANRFQVLPAELCNVHKLTTLDVSSNMLKYNVSNWPYDWNWNRNTNLKYLNFSANKRLEIKPATHPNQSQFNGGEVQDLTSFNTLKYLRVLGLMDVTLLTNTIPDDNEDRRVRTSASLAGALLYGMADTLGKNDHLATLDLLKPNYRGHEAEILVGVFDGQSISNGGSKIAKYLQENFATAFAAELDKAKSNKGEPSDALRRTFLNLNKDMANYATSAIDTKEHRLANGHRGSVVANSLSHDDLNTGSVATVLYLNGTELFCANVGDIEAILIQSTGQYRPLTKKHDPAESGERDRIRAAGGYVSRQGKLNDTLEVSRAFGFFIHMPSVIAAPSIEKVQLGDTDELILIATKEFWDFVTTGVALDVARYHKDDLMFAAQKLRDLAIAFGARDKIMVMVLGVADLRKRNNNRFRGTSLSMARELTQDDGQIFPSRRKGKTIVGDSKLARFEEPEAPVGQVAICFTDIKNSTALWEVLPVPMRTAISMHNDLMRRQLRIIGGYEVKTEGDAFMCSFPTATSALLWCFSCQSHLLELPWPNEIMDTVHCQEKFDAEHNVIYRGLSVRMGIHWGEPVCDPDPITRRMDYFGPMVNKAARVSAVADGGQISVSTDFVKEITRVREAYVDDDRRDSVGSQDTATADDPIGDRIRKELQQISSQGFEVQDLGERKLKGLENPEFIYLMYPHSLAGRLSIPPGGPEKPSIAGPELVGQEGTQQPGALDASGQLSSGGLDLSEVWRLWDIALRLEMLCSSLENPDLEGGLRKPELSLLDRMKDRGGVISDAFMMNLLEHQVTRVESCVTTLQIRHMVQPLRKGVSFQAQARPINDILGEVGKALSMYAEVREARGA